MTTLKQIRTANPCPFCNGTGRIKEYSHVSSGVCYRCAGSGVWGLKGMMDKEFGKGHACCARCKHYAAKRYTEEQFGYTKRRTPFNEIERVWTKLTFCIGCAAQRDAEGKNVQTPAEYPQDKPTHNGRFWA